MSQAKFPGKLPGKLHTTKNDRYGPISTKGPTMKTPAYPVILGITLLSLTLPATALLTTLLTTTDAHSATWRETKCTLYQENRDETRAAMPANATSNAFNQQEDAFIASGCTEPFTSARTARLNLRTPT